jgi:hypothetical protein
MDLLQRHRHHRHHQCFFPVERRVPVRKEERPVEIFLIISKEIDMNETTYLVRYYTKLNPLDHAMT